MSLPEGYPVIERVPSASRLTNHGLGPAIEVRRAIFVMANRFSPSLSDDQFAALPLSERFVLVAAYMSDVAKVQETAAHDNHGPEIDAWCRTLKQGNGGIPWCGIFVSICLRLAGYRGKLPPNPASTHSWAEWAREHGISRISTAPQRGDIFVLLFSPTTGHMGIVVGREEISSRTIEGNSNDDGSRDGYKVVRHERILSPKGSTVIIDLAAMQKARGLA